ncbi:Vacuolar protein sorting-associated protein 13C [Halotydeus destructor]|nr:Vacuolar protein sorting-associated protein 13C [Halotydeus destructor]
MFESVVARLLNQYLGKYVENLNSENLKLGIFSGTVQLTDVKLKAEALYQLELPVCVVAGNIGKITLDIPWTSLKSEPVIINCEDILILGRPLNEQAYDAELDRKVTRVAKRKVLEALAEKTNPKAQLPVKLSFIESLIANIVNNVQISIQNFHLRFESTTIRGDNHAVAAGIVMKSLTAVTTSSKWKPVHLNAKSKSIFKVVKLETFYVYWNAKCSSDLLVSHDISGKSWAIMMKQSIHNCSILKDDFDFLLKPITIKVKLIMNKTAEDRTPKLLVDCVLQDACVEMSQDQYISMTMAYNHLMRVSVNRKFWYLRPSVSVKQSPPSWWRYAIQAIRDEYVRPKSWSQIKMHRQKYRRYRELYQQLMHEPDNLDLKSDCDDLEDELNVVSIVCAQEEAKNRIQLDDSDQDFSFDQFDSGHVINKNTIWSLLSSDEKQFIKDWIESDADDRPDGGHDLDKFIAHKVNVTLTSLTVSLTDNIFGVTDKREVLVVNMNQILASLETQSSIKHMKLSLRIESLVAEGLVGGDNPFELIPIISAEHSLRPRRNSSTSSDPKTHVVSIDVVINPYTVDADYAVSGNLGCVEFLYQKFAYQQLISFLTSVPQLFSRDDMRLRKVSRDAADLSTATCKALITDTWLNGPICFIEFECEGPRIIVPQDGAADKCGPVLVLDMGLVSIKTNSTCLEDVDTPRLDLSDWSGASVEDIIVTTSNSQLMFCDNGEEWRSGCSDVSLVSQFQAETVIGCSTRDRKLNADYSVTSSVRNIHFRLSDRRVKMLHTFVDSLISDKKINSAGDSTDANNTKTICTYSFDKSTSVSVSARKVLLADKMQTGPSGGYLEILSEGVPVNEEDECGHLYHEGNLNGNVFKVTMTTCDSVRDPSKRLNVLIGNLKANFHGQSVLTMMKFCEYVMHNVPDKLKSSFQDQVDSLTCQTNDKMVDTLEKFNAHGLSFMTQAKPYSIVLVFKLTSLKVVLSELDNVELADVSVEDVKVDYQLSNEGKLQVNGALASLTIRDPRRDTFYPVMFQKSNEAMKFLVFNMNETTDPRNIIQVNEVQIVFLYKFFASVNNFLDPFLSNQDVAVMEQAVSRLFDDNVAGHIHQIKIEIIKPTIIFPQKAKSNNVVVLSFQDVIIQNTVDTDSLNIVQVFTADLNRIVLKRGYYILSEDYVSKLTLTDVPLISDCSVKLKLDSKMAAIVMETLNVHLYPADACVLSSVVQDNFLDPSIDMIQRPTIYQLLTQDQINKIKTRLTIDCKSTEILLLKTEGSYLTKLTMTGISLSLEDSMKMSVASVLLQDVRSQPKTVFQADDYMLSVDCNQSAEDSSVDLKLNQIQANCSLSFLVDVCQFFGNGANSLLLHDCSVREILTNVKTMLFALYHNVTNLVKC